MPAAGASSRSKATNPSVDVSFWMIPSRRHLVRTLIYPVPDPRFPFLGVHLTSMIDGTVHAGPNAVLALAREGYRWRDVDRHDLTAMATDAASWRLARRYWRTGLGEVGRSLSRARFVRALQRLVPELTPRGPRPGRQRRAGPGGAQGRHPARRLRLRRQRRRPVGPATRRASCTW